MGWGSRKALRCFPGWLGMLFFVLPSVVCTAGEEGLLLYETRFDPEESEAWQVLESVDQKGGWSLRGVRDRDSHSPKEAAVVTDSAAKEGTQSLQILQISESMLAEGMEHEDTQLYLKLPNFGAPLGHGERLRVRVSMMLEGRGNRAGNVQFAVMCSRGESSPNQLAHLQFGLNLGLSYTSGDPESGSVRRHSMLERPFAMEWYTFVITVSPESQTYDLQIIGPDIEENIEGIPFRDEIEGRRVDLLFWRYRSAGTTADSVYVDDILVEIL